MQGIGTIVRKIKDNEAQKTQKSLWKSVYIAKIDLKESLPSNLRLKFETSIDALVTIPGRPNETKYEKHISSLLSLDYNFESTKFLSKVSQKSVVQYQI